MKLLGSAAIVLAVLTLAGCASTGTPEVELVGGSTMTVSKAIADPADYDIQGLGDEGISFTADDGNISCGIESTEEFGRYYGCYIAEYTYADPDRPAGVEVSCGHGFQARNDEAPSLLCSGEPAPYAGVQEYGNPDEVVVAGSLVNSLESGWQITHNDTTCTNESETITCENEYGGFELSRDSYELF